MNTILKIFFWVIVMSFVAAVVSCTKEDPKPKNVKGCQSGADPTTGQIVTYRCATHEEFLAGSNTSKGGTPSFNYYKNNKWEECQKCH